MARYGGSIQYGRGKYGASSASNRLSWAVEVDWDGDGAFDGQNEARYATALHVRRGRDYWMNADGSGFEHMRAGDCSITLDNSSGRYDPYNARSPLFPNVLPGRFARVRVMYAGVITPLFAGRVADIKPTSGARRQVKITLTDGLRWLADEDVAVRIQQGIAVDDAMQMLLEAASWPEMWGMALDSSVDVLPYWWEDGRSAAAALHDLADSTLGTFLVRADGSAAFYSRHHQSAPAASFTQREIHKEIPMPQPWEVVRNIIKVDAHPRVLCASAQLWQLDDVLQVPARSSAEVWAPFQYNGRDVPAVNVVEPELETDYRASSMPDGAGIDLTSSVDVRMDCFSKSAKLAISNRASVPAYVHQLAVRGMAVDSLNAVSVMSEDAASKAVYGPRRFTLSTNWLQGANDAMGFAEFLKNFLSQPRAFPQVSVEARPELQFGVDLLDSVSASIDALGIGGNFRVGAIEHEWLLENGQAVRTAWKLEPIPDLSAYWQFPVRIGTNSIFAF